MNNTFLYIVTVLIWGSTWFAINFQLGEVAPEVSVSYRFGLASFILFLIITFKKLNLRFNARDHLRFFLFGCCLFGFNYYLLYTAQQHINSALTCIAFSTLLLVNIINARIWFNTKVTGKVYFGGGLGLIGIIILFSPQLADVELGAETAIGLGLCLIGTLFASTGNMLSISNQQKKLPIMQTNAWAMLYGALIMATVAMISGKEFTFEYSLPYISSLIYLSLFGSVIAFGCYLTLLTQIGAHKASYANIMFPAVAVVLSTLFEGFEWHIETVIGFILIVIGNLIVLSRPRKTAELIKPLAVETAS